MASIKFIVKTKKNPSFIYIRFYHSKSFDITVKSGILINPKHWSNKQQRFKNIADIIPDKDLISKRIDEIRSHISSKYTKAYSEGEIITKLWMQNTIDRFNNRPKDGNDFETYFVPFIEKWIEESKTRINISTGKKINNKTIQKYYTTVKRIKELEVKHKFRLKHSDIGLHFHKLFVNYLVIDENYGNSTIEKYISQIRTFCREAEVEGYKVNPEYKSRKFSFRRNKPLDPYLNKEEINKIYNLNKLDDRLDNIRDLFIIGLWTGLRVSDFKQLKRMNIIKDDIVVASTKKTGVPVRIPIHHQVREVLNKRNGEIPHINVSEKALENLFNREVKNLAKLANITDPILGDKRDSETNRDVRGVYPKNELISSHICRRSFVSNHYGNLPNQSIMAITGHSSEKQLLDYVKISNENHIEKVRKYWEDEENKKLNLKIV